MTYDALLSLRGWGEPEFRLVAPSFLEAARFALFAEKLAPILEQARVDQTMPLPTEPRAKLTVAGRRMAAAGLIPVLRSLLELDGE